MKKLLLLAFSVAVAACGPAQAVLHPSLAAALKLRYTAGQTLAYKFSANINMTETVPGFGKVPVVVVFSATETEKVLSVAKDGTATIQVSISGMTGTANGKPLPATTTVPPVTMQISPDGHIVSGGSAGPNISIPGTDQLTPLLPSNKVKPGDTWSRTYTRPNPFGSGGMTVTSQNKFLRYDTLGGVKYAVVQTQAQIPLNVNIDLSKMSSLVGGGGGHPVQGTATYAGNITMNMTSWVSPSAQSLYKVIADMNMNADITLPGQTSGPIHMGGAFTFNVVRE